MSSHDVMPLRELLRHCLTSACHDSRDVTSQQYHVATGCGTNPAAGSSQLPQAGGALGATNTCPGQGAPGGTMASHGESLNHGTAPTAGPELLLLPQPLQHGLPTAFPEGWDLFPPRAIFNPTQKSSAFSPLPSPCLDTRTACF